MKIKFLFFYIFIFLISCRDPNETFTGYLVAKEYIPEHMSNESERRISCAAFVPIPVVTPKPPPAPYKIYSRWIWYVANKSEVIDRDVSERIFNTRKCGEKITIKRY